MENTRAKIIDVLRRRHEVTVDDLTQALALAPATVRRHLDILQRDGHVMARPVRRDTGRPHYAFTLTEQGHDLLPHQYIRVTSRVLQEIVALQPQETAGLNGEQVAGLVLERMADNLARTVKARISGTSLDERLPQAVAVLADEGVVFHVGEHEDGYVVSSVECLCRRFSEKQAGMCGREQRLLSRVLDVDVETVTCEDAGGCAYLVKCDRALAAFNK